MTRTYFCLLCTSALVTVAAAVAADTKVISGSACVPWGSYQQSISLGQPTFDGKYAVGDTDFGSAICPIVRDHNTARLDNIYVRIRIASSSGDAECVARTISGTGSAYYATDPVTLSGTGSIFLEVDDIPVFSGGSYWVSCALDEADIVSVRWGEPSE